MNNQSTTGPSFAYSIYTSLNPEQSAENPSKLKQFLRKIFTVTLLSGTVLICCLVYLAMALFAMIKGLEIESHTMLFYRL